MKRREFSTALVRGSLAAGALAGGMPLAVAQGGAPVAGKDYVVINPPVATPANGKIEVVEFFWYGCPHCNAFEPMLEAWAKKLSADVDRDGRRDGSGAHIWPSFDEAIACGLPCGSQSAGPSRKG